MGSSSLDDRILRDYVRRVPLTLALLRAFECRVLKELELLHPAFLVRRRYLRITLFPEFAEVGLDASFT